jgi:hypothetical protein
MCVMRALVCVFGVVMATASHADEVRYTTDEYGNPTIWQEDNVPLPPFPEGQNLVRVSAPIGGGRNQYFVDRASIAPGKDRVVRYTVVVRSPSGVQNVMHEGLACDVREVKTYAYGNSQREFKALSRPSWGPLTHRGVKGYQGVLADRFLCDESRSYSDRDWILDRLDTAESQAEDDIGVSGNDDD